MPAPKRGSSPHESQPKMRKLDEDGQDLSSKTAPAANNRSLKTGNTLENAAAPRTKKKLPVSAEEGNIPAKSSKQSSPPMDPSKTMSDPPVKKAKLLKATSASCGEAPSHKATLKRTASTDSEDDLSSDSSKTELFRERDDDDKARCIRQYCNRVRAKRRFEESTSSSQETSQGSPSAPGDPVQMDHNYGRFSDSSVGEEEKESEEPVIEQEGQETTVSTTQTDSQETVISVRGSAEAGIEYEFASGESKHEDFKNAESQKLLDNDGAASCREIPDFVTATAAGSSCNTSESEGNKKMDFAIESQKDVDNKTLATSVEMLYSDTGETEVPVKDCLSTACGHQTDMSLKTETKEITESASKEVKLDIKCKNTEAEQEVIAVANMSTDYHHVEDKGVSNETNSAPEEILIGGSDSQSQTVRNLTTDSIQNIETQTDLSVKIEVTFKEESKAKDLVNHNMPDSYTNSCDTVSKSEEMLKESESRGVVFPSIQTAAGPGSYPELQPSQEMVNRTTDSGAEILTLHREAVPEQNQDEAPPDCVTVSEGQINVDMQTEETPEENKLNQGDHSVDGQSAEIAVEVTEDTITNEEKEMQVKFECATAEPEQEISNEAATVEIQSQKNQEVSEHATDKCAEFEKDYVLNSEIMENEDWSRSGSERQTTVADDTSSPASTGEVQNQESPGVSECTTNMSDKEQENTVAVCQNTKVKGRDDAKCDAAENQVEVTPTEISNVAPKLMEVSEPTTDPSADLHVDYMAINMGHGNEVVLKYVTAPESQMEMQTTSTSEVSHPATSVEIQNSMHMDRQTTAASLEKVNTISAVEMKNKKSPNEVNMEITTTTPEEISNVATTVKMQNQHVSEAATGISEEENKLNSVTATENPMEMQTTTTEVSNPDVLVEIQKSQVDIQTVPASEEISNMTQTEKWQKESEPTIYISPDINEEQIKEESESASTPESPVEMQTASTSEEMSNIATPVEKQSPNEVNMETAVTSEQIFKMTPTAETEVLKSHYGSATESVTATESLPFQSTSTSEEMSNTAIPVEVQSEKNPNEMNVETASTSVEIFNMTPTTEVQKSHDGPASDLSAGHCEEENKVNSEFLSAPETLMEMQTASSSEVSNPDVSVERQKSQVDTKTVPASEEISDMKQTQKSQEESEPATCIATDLHDEDNKLNSESVTATESLMPLQTTSTSEEMSNTVEVQSEKNPNEMNVETASTSVEIFIMTPTTEKEVQKTHDGPASDLSAGHSEEENKVNIESLSAPENPMEMESASTSQVSNSGVSVEGLKNQVDTQTVPASDEISDMAPAAERETQKSQGESEPTTYISTDLYEEENMLNSESVTATESPMELQTTSISEEMSNMANPVEVQSEKSPNEMNVETASTSVEIFNMTLTTEEQKSHDGPASELSSAHCEEENKVTIESLSVPEDPMEMESASTSEVSNLADSVEIQKSQIEAGMQTVTALGEISNTVSTVEAESLKSPIVGNVETTATSDISGMTPTVETQVQRSQKVPEPVIDISEKSQEGLTNQSPESDGNVNKVLAQCVSAAENQREMDLQTAATLEETSDPTTKGKIQRVQEVSELPKDVEAMKDFIFDKTESEENKEKVTVGRVDAAEAQIEMDVTPEEILNPPSVVELQSQEVSERHAEVQKDQVENEDKVTAECVDVPEVQMDVEGTVTPEEISKATQQQNKGTEDINKPASLNEPHESLPMAESKDNGNAHMEPSTEDMQEEMDVISGSIERIAPALEEETGMQMLNEVKEEVADIPSDKAHSDAEVVSNTEGHGEGSTEVIVFVCDQPNDILTRAPEPFSQSEVEFHENQIVYEPISSPESNDDREIPSVSKSHDGMSLLDIQNDQQLEGDSSTKEGSSQQLKKEDSQQQISASDSGEVVMEVPECSISAHLEQSSTMSVDSKQVISCSDDINLPEDAAGQSERNKNPDCISATEVPEQLQEDAGLQQVPNITMTTTADAEIEIPDSTSEDFVILEPVQEDQIHFDIVTQAAAESGLSASLSEQVNSTLKGEEENERMTDGSHQAVFPDAEGQQCQTASEIKVVDSSEVLDQGARFETEMSTEEGVELIPNSDHSQRSSCDVMAISTSGTEMENSCTQAANQDCNALVLENTETNLDLQEVQIIGDIEIGREIVVAEEENDEDGDITIIEKPQEASEAAPPSPKTSEKPANEKTKDDVCGTSLKQNRTAEKGKDDRKETEPQKPKKQEMNTQARTKARLAALAEQKAAAAKRTANRQQLNLLALCHEIAEDIATDSMLLKRIEEEKQAAALAAKIEDSKKDRSPVNTQEAEAVPVVVATAAGPEGSSEEAASTQPSTDDSAKSTVEAAKEPIKEPAKELAAEPPKRRFFVTQISVPLKAHEKKKLTRYQRLRQVELQREKMSWARVKKLKSDQANQMFSDMDWQVSPFTLSTVTVVPPPAASPSKTPLPSPASASTTPTPKAEAPKVEAPKAEAPKAEVPKAEPPKVDTPNAESSKTEPAKTVPSKTEPAKPDPDKPEASKTAPPNAGTRKSARQLKAQAAKESPAQEPAPKGTKSAAKRSLPAVPPPMPNGFTPPKPKPVEYKPYRPRPKYSFEDFELDDDPVPVTPMKTGPQSRPAQVTRPTSAQSNTTAQSKPMVQSKPALSPHPANQAKLKGQATPAGQISGQSKPAAAAANQSKLVASAAAQLKPAVARTPAATTVATSKQAPPLKAGSEGQSKTAVAAAPQLKPTGGGRAALLQSAAPKAAGPTTAEMKPAAPSTHLGTVPQKISNPPASEDGKCKDTAEATSSLSSEDGSKESDNTQKCDEKPAVADVDPPPESKAETAETAEKTSEEPQDRAVQPRDGRTPLSEACLQKEVKKLEAADKDGNQTIIDAGQKHFGAVACTVCGMLYSAANPEDESQHLLFHNQFISAVKYVGWKKERILAEYPDGKIILVLPDDPKYALKKVEEIREMVDNDLGFQQAETKCPSQTKTFLFISSDKKVGGCLIAEHIQEGYRVIEEPAPEGSEGEKLMFERQRAWCCSTTAEPAICGISRIWVVNMMRRQGIASRMLECLRNNFIYGSYLSKDEIAFSDPTPDGKLFATHYFGTSQFLVYNFVSGTRSSQPNTDAV